MIAADSCARWGPSHTLHTGAPFALWIYPDRVSILLCRGALDVWLDQADDDPDLEPAELTFVPQRR